MNPSPFPDLITRLPAFDGPFDAKRIAADSCDILFARYPGGTTIEDHRHETDNVGIITTGELILVIEGHETRYRSGDWYQVPAGQTHAARFEKDTAEIEFWFPPR